MLDVTALKEAQQDLERSREELRRLASHREERVEQERARLAREFHDVPIIVDHVSNLAAEEGAPNHGIDDALAALVPTPAHALIDGNQLPRELCCPAKAVVDGDAIHGCISAASILAKVTRDRLMRDMDARYPGYGFASHKGYSTPEHFEALNRLGPCPQHRRSFAPVRRLLEPDLFDALPTGPVLELLED